MFTRCNIKHHNWCFWTVVLKTLESLLDCKEIKAVNPKGNRSWIFIGRTDAEAETPILWLPDAKNWLIWKDPDAGKDWRWEEKGTTEDEMVGWHHRLDGYEFEQALGVGDGQGGLACCSPWSCKESDTTEQLNWTEQDIGLFFSDYLLFLVISSIHFGASLVAQKLKHLPAMRKTRVRFLGWEDPLEKEMAIHSSTLAWKIPWMEEPDRLQSMGSQRVGHDWATLLSLSIHFSFCLPLTYSLKNRPKDFINSITIFQLYVVIVLFLESAIF